LYKEKVESGEFVPDELRRKIEEKLERTPQEEELLKKAKAAAAKRDKVQWLKLEQKLLDLDVAIKEALHEDQPDMNACLRALDDLYGLALTPLMLKKQVSAGDLLIHSN